MMVQKSNTLKVIGSGDWPKSVKSLRKQADFSRMNLGMSATLN